MKYLPTSIFALVTLIVLGSCLDQNENEVVLSCEPNTAEYGGFILKFYGENPTQSSFRNPSRQEAVCWEDSYPIDIGGSGVGNCGLGYEDVENPVMGTAISLVEYDPNAEEFTYAKRYLEVRAVFACEDFSTRASFFNLFAPAAYGFADEFDDFDKFVIEYLEDGVRYSSLGVSNTLFNVTLSDLEASSDEDADFIRATVRFSALLRAENGDYLLVENAEVRGRFFRMSPFGVEWED